MSARGPGIRRLAMAALALLLGNSCALPPEPEARAERLSPAWRLLLPEGEGPHPAALLLSGCDGVHDNMGFWADAFVASGRAALIVDSHGPRGLDRGGAWALVCAAQALRGPTRAGDVAVALDALAGMEGVDATDVVILGASHGGWAAMEFVGLAGAGTVPPGLARWPEPPDEVLARVSALVLLYNYCGALNGAVPAGWAGAPPALMILAEDDTVVSTPACLARADALRGAGASVRAEVVAGADHGFDQAEKSALSGLDFDAGQRARARDLVAGFLGDLDP